MSTDSADVKYVSCVRAPVLGIPKLSIVFHHSALSKYSFCFAAACMESNSMLFGVARSILWFG